MQFFSPKGFKRGAYYFNRYDGKDLLILIPSVIVGIILFLFGVFIMILTENIIFLAVLLPLALVIIFTAIILTTPLEIYHNVLGKITAVIRFKIKQKKFIWKGYDYDNYNYNEDEV